MTWRPADRPKPTTAPDTPLAVERFLVRIRRSWQATELTRAVTSAVAVALLASAFLAGADLLTGLPASWRSLLRFLPLAIGAAALAVRLRGMLHGGDVGRVALLAEEQVPELEGYLTTSLEPPGTGPVSAAFRRRAEAKLRQLQARARVASRMRRPLSLLLASAVALVAVAAISPAAVLNRWISPVTTAQGDSGRPGGGDSGAAETDPDDRDSASALRIRDLRWTIEAPPYTGLPTREELGPPSIEAYAGSRIRLHADLTSPSRVLTARLAGGQALAVERQGQGGWVAEWILDASHRGVALEASTDGETVARRVVPLRVQTDRPPGVQLIEPAADLVVASATGRVKIRASARDDFGIQHFRLGWIHSSGGGESFSFEDGEWEWTRVWREGGTVHGEHTLDLADMGLGPGDVVHIRAVASDGNTVTGPGTGVSPTRSIRVARDDEAAEITTLIGFPLEAEAHPVLSQRMIILMTEELRDTASSLTRVRLLDESARIAAEQGRLRDRTGDEVFVRESAQEGDEAGHLPDDPGHAQGDPGHVQGDPDHDDPDDPDQADPPAAGAAERLRRTLELASQATGLGLPEERMHLHDESVLFDMNPIRLAAFNAMWEAERLLRQGELDASLPHQYEALGYLQQQKEVNRVFARGRQTVAPVDVEAARGTGRLTDVVASPRSPAGSAASTAARLAELEEILPRIADRDPGEASLELAALALRVLDDDAADPAAAALLSAAADAAAAGEPERAHTLAARARAVLLPGSEAGRAPPVPSATTSRAAEYFRRLGGRP